MTEGKVWLVGAGPGDTGLITVKGEQVLKEAQVVVYDHLVNPDLLARYGDGKRFINVGKQAGRHLIPQQEIQEILARCEMGEIYIVNPYECFILMCLLTDCPLAVFSEIWEKSYEEGEEKN